METRDAPKPIRILIADDQTLFASSLRIVLDGYAGRVFAVVGVARDGKECVELCARTRPEMVLMDVRMPEMDGVEATRIIHERYPDVKIMMLTTFDDDAYVTQALSSGATGYVLKNVQPDELADSIRAVHNGTMLVSPSVGYRFFSQPFSQPLDAGSAAAQSERSRRLNTLQARFPDLKKREAEVLLLVLQGMDNHQISQALFIAEQTVKNYTSMIYAKIGVEDRLEAIRLFGGRQ